MGMTSIYRSDFTGFKPRLYMQPEPVSHAPLNKNKINAIGHQNTNGAPASIQRPRFPSLSNATIASKAQSAPSAKLTQKIRRARRQRQYRPPRRSS